MSNGGLAILLFWILFNQKDGRFKHSNSIWAFIACIVTKFITASLIVFIEAYK